MKFLLSTEFTTGAFLGFVFTSILFTIILTNMYTPNILLNQHGFYRDGKQFVIVEKSRCK